MMFTETTAPTACPAESASFQPLFRFNPLQLPADGVPSEQLHNRKTAGLNDSKTAGPQDHMTARLLPLPDTAAILPGFLTPRMVKFFLLPAVLFTALYTREYTGEYQMVINNHVGGIFYVLFGSLLFSYVFKRMRIWHAVSLALGILSLLEVLQGFRIPFVMYLTQNPLLSYLFGNSFNPADFIFYGLGAAAGLLVLWVLHENKAESLPAEPA